MDRMRGTYQVPTPTTPAPIRKPKTATAKPAVKATVKVATPKAAKVTATAPVKETAPVAAA